MFVVMKNGALNAAAGICLGLAAPALILGKAWIFIGLLVPILAISVTLLSPQNQPFKFPRRLSNEIIWLTAITMIFWFVSCVLSADVSKSMSTWVRTIALIPLFYFVVWLLRTEKSIHNISLKSITSGYAAVLIFANFSLYVDAFFFDLYASLFKLEFVSKFVHISPVLLQMLKPFYSVAACILPIVLWAGLRLGGTWKYLAFISIPLTAALLYGKGQQPGMSAIFGLAASFLAFLLILICRKLSMKAIKISVLFGVVAVFSFAIFILSNLPIPPVLPEPAPKLAIPDWHRQVIWGFTFDIGMKNPWFGVGPNTINLLPGASDIIPGMNQEYVPSHPHNWVLEIFSETGFVGITSSISLVSLFAWILFQRAKKGDSSAVAIIALLASFLCSSLGNFSIWSIWWLSVFGLLLCLALATNNEDHQIDFRSTR